MIQWLCSKRILQYWEELTILGTSALDGRAGPATRKRSIEKRKGWVSLVGVVGFLGRLTSQLDIWKMARTKRTECLWAPSLTACVHYRWSRDWFVSLSKTPAPVVVVVPPLLVPCCYLASIPALSFRRFISAGPNQPPHLDCLSPPRLCLFPIVNWQCTEAAFHGYQLVGFARRWCPYDLSFRFRFQSPFTLCQFDCSI